MNHLIAGKAEVPCEAPIVLWSEHKQVSPSRLNPRKKTDLVTCHWTGGEGSFEEFCETLTLNKRSVHFWVDANEDEDGYATVYQLCDADMLAAHAEGMNVRAVGIEGRNRGALLPVRPIVRRIKREILQEVVNGRLVKYCAFLPSQVKSFIALTRALCGHYELPFVVPMERITRPAERVHPEAERVIPRQLTLSEFEPFRGVCGHYHWSPEKHKVDPAPALLTSIAAAEPRYRPDREGPLRPPGAAE